MIEYLMHWDSRIFLWVNSGGVGTVWSMLLPFFREKLFWLPMYVFLFAFLAFNFSRRHFILSLLLIITTVAIADTLSSKVIKPMVRRERPCNDEVFQKMVILRAGCGGGYSFTSSHATNHFALAFVFFVIFKGVFRLRWMFFLWAASIALAQVYVGVHYPLDVICGACLGTLIGWGMTMFSREFQDFLDERSGPHPLKYP